MSRMTAFSNPLLLGFEQVEELLDQIAKSAGDGYPPYNIERLPSDGHAERLKITLAVAGFEASDLEVEIEAATLTIRGAQADDPGREYLHRGIAARRFERKFVLADGIEIAGAELADGLLSIDLVREFPKRAARQVEITDRN